MGEMDGEIDANRGRAGLVGRDAIGLAGGSLCHCRGA